ncbi:hypothetical protein CA267_015760 [Alteromonas pelagimontana]|uniref:Smp protein n=1 Tax=Alteromonas pelagimontana TaxID=1858656 RepID=A0A6M4MGA8_9ALTE|nr:AhpA/YtjB family protein [Alteromonas pelagimontana]QJR82102.1 hypothetical protein CA267_015760 [Alteromonas pelagimontana]
MPSHPASSTESTFPGNPISDQRASQLVSHSGYRVLKQIFHTLLLAAIMLLILYVVITYQKQQQAWLLEQAAEPGKTLVRQYSQILAPAVQDKDTQTVTATLAILASEPRVLAATVFDSQGEIIAPLDSTSSVVSKTYLNPFPPVTQVQDIVNDAGTTTGYLRLLVDQRAQLAKPLARERDKQPLIVAVGFITFFTGFYVARFFYKLRPLLQRRYKSLFVCENLNRRQ